ncbi:MAG TPA: hypothetical protein DCK95_07300 [Anaerolineaceae bacterium]|nr:hypothetical protein [Anaerolineaceae bacterium]
MNVLITGYLGAMVASLTRELTKTNTNKIILAGSNAKVLSDKLVGITIHTIDPADPLFYEVLSSNDFDAIIFNPIREEQLLAGENPISGRLLDGLINILNFYKNKTSPWLIFLSSTEVYERIDINSPTIESPQKDSMLNKNILLTCEQYCQYYNHFYHLNTSIIRLPFVYGPEENHSFLHTLISDCLKNSAVDIPANQESLCSFLHANDVANFIIRLLDEKYTHDFEIFNLTSPDTFSLNALAQNLHTYFPDVKFNFLSRNNISTKPVNGKLAKMELNWTPSHRLENSLEDLISQLKNKPEPKQKFFDQIKAKLASRPNLLKWLELILGGAVMQGLVYLTGTFVQFKYIDFRLLYVILIGSAYGIRFGLLASLIAGASNLYSWYQLGLDWELLIYHVENWLPFALYLIAGSITGYLWDKKENETNFANKQLALTQEKYAFLYNIYEDTRKTKNQLREQLIGYRDSYGRIYTITRELDSLNSNDVFLKALDIIEDVMINKSAAIYSLDQSARFARLEVSSTSLVESTPKSLNMTDFPEAVKQIKNGEMFYNKSLLPDYPSLIAPIMKDQQPLGMIFIWKRTFEQHSMYYENLFKVVSGLIESSLVRAVLFREANLAKWYMPSTIILEADFFKETLKIKMEMQNRDITKFQLISIDKGEMSWQNFSAVLEKGIRTTDYAGLLEKTTNVCYVILSQAEESSITVIINRLTKLGLVCKIVESNAIINV